MTLFFLVFLRKKLTIYIYFHIIPALCVRLSGTSFSCAVPLPVVGAELAGVAAPVFAFILIVT